MCDMSLMSHSSVWKPSLCEKKSVFFDAQTRCLAYIEWVFEIFCAVKKDYRENCMLYSAEQLGILSVHIIAHGEPTFLETLHEEFAYWCKMISP